MKKANWIFLILLTYIICSQDTSTADSGTTPSPAKLTLLHTNDLHSRLNVYSLESAYTPLTVNDDFTIGGFARIASILERERDH
jgi:2',3'-cyclic-nucleotide 2'-phosphodiesterase (5'-nucleotidase family)